MADPTPIAGAISGLSVPIRRLGGVGILLSTALMSGTVTPPVDPPPPLTGFALAAPTPPLPATLRVQSWDAYANPPVCCVQPFGPGHVPPGYRVRLRTAGGTEISVQQDFESTWPDNSINSVELSFVAPDTFTADQIKTYTVDTVPGTPDRTPSYTLQQVAATTSFKLRARGYSWGNAVGELDVNAIIAAQSGSVDNWGTATPTRGIELIASGPVRMEWRFWAIARRVSDGALHESVVFDLYARRWAATGAWQFTFRQRQPNPYAAHAGSTWSTTGWNQGNVGIVELFNGNTLLAAMGGPNDEDSRSVPPSAFNVAGSYFQIPVGQALGQASGYGQQDSRGSWSPYGTAIGFEGPSLPGGIVANKPHYIANRNGYVGEPVRSQVKLATARQGGYATTSYLTITSAPTSNVTVYPLFHSYPGSGSVGADHNCDRFWLGSGAKPRIRVGHDEAYLTKSTRLMFPMDLSLPRPAEPGGMDNDVWTTHPYRPGQVLNGNIWDPGNASDNAHEDRIGWLSRQHANLVLTPFDRRRHCHVHALGLSQQDLFWDWEDPRSMRVPVVNNGPAADGVTYPKMAPPATMLFYNKSGTLGSSLVSPQSPAFTAMANGNFGGSGYNGFRYNPLNEASHYPNWQVVPYIRSGDRVHFDIMRTNVASFFPSSNPGERQRILKPPVVPVQRQFWMALEGQVRSHGWMLTATSNLLYFMPKTHAERQYFDDAFNDYTDYLALTLPINPMKHLGAWLRAPKDGNFAAWGPNTGGSLGFQGIYGAIGTATCIYRGMEKLRPALEMQLAAFRDMADDQQRPNGDGYFSNIYFAQLGATSASPYLTRQAMIESETLLNASTNTNSTRPAGERYNRGGSATPPFATNSTWQGRAEFYIDQPAQYLTAYIVQQCALLAVCDWLGFQGCARVRLQLLNRWLTMTVKDRALFSSLAAPAQMGAQWSVLPSTIPS